MIIRAGWIVFTLLLAGVACCLVGLSLAGIGCLAASAFYHTCGRDLEL